MVLLLLDVVRRFSERGSFPRGSYSGTMVYFYIFIFGYLVLYLSVLRAVACGLYSLLLPSPRPVSVGVSKPVRLHFVDLLIHLALIKSLRAGR